MEELEQLQQIPSYDWSFEMLAMVDGLQIVLNWNDDEPASPYPGFSWIHCVFKHPDSWAHADYSQMWQHRPDDAASPVLQIAPHFGDSTHVFGIRLNLGLHDSGWLNDQIVACDDAVSIISRENPRVTLCEMRPQLVDWPIDKERRAN